MSRRQQLALILGVTAMVIAIRATAPSDLATGDQPYQVEYIEDIVARGNWVAQHLRDGTPATKPPLYNWLAAPLIVVTDWSGDFALKLPSVLAGIALALLVWDFTRRIASERAATIAALLLVTTTMSVKLIYFARTDMLLALFIALQLHAALRQRAAAYGVAAALAMLTKGPIGILLPLAALTTWWLWRGELRAQWRALRLTLVLPLALLPFVLWLAAAVAIEGRPLWNQLVYAETLDRFTSGSSKAKEHRHVLYYVPHFMVRFAPASLFAIVAIASRERKRVLLAVCWVVAMLVCLSLVPSKRADRLFPLLPGVCALAGWALDTRPRGTRAVMHVIAAILLGAGVYALGRDGVQLAGVVLVLLAVAMFFVRRYEVAFLIAALLVVNFTYQHWLSEPAKRNADIHPVASFATLRACRVSERVPPLPP
jgi:4-amino-4-deoxy-L-arabinose transferase-like glycosyltransferase